MSTIAPPKAPVNPALLDSEHYIDHQIGRTRRALKLVDFSAGLITLSIGLLTFLLAAAVLDHWIVPGGLNTAGRMAMFGVLVAGVAWYAWRQFVPLLRPINPVYAAHTIERGSPSLKNSLLNLLLFRTNRQKMSMRIYSALQQQAAQRLSAATLESAIDHSVLLRLGYALVLIVAVCAVYAALSPKDLAVSAGRVIAPWSDVPAPSRVQILDIQPGETSIARGERLAISAAVHGLNSDETVRLRYSTADEQRVDESLAMTQPPEATRFEAYLPRKSDGVAHAGVRQDLHYWIEAGDARSRRFKVTVFQRPTIVVQRVRYEFPSYTGYPSKEVDDTGDVRGLEGTNVTISALANQPIKSAYVDFNADGRNDLKMNVDGDRATAAFPLALRPDRRTPVHGSYILRFTSESGRTNSDPAKYRIDVTPDYAPEVRITQPEEPERPARVDEIVLIGVEARDPDFAVAQLRLVGKVGRGEEMQLAELLSENQEGRVGAIEPFTPGDAKLKPGDVLEYWAEARDNRRPEANIGVSEHRRLKIVAPPDQAPPPKGQQPPQAGQQPQQGNPQQGDNPQAGAEGEPQQEGDQGAQGQAGGDNKESSDGEGQQGPGGTAGGEGEPSENAEQQEGGGAAGQSGNSQSNNSDQEQQPPGAGGAAASDNQKAATGGRAAQQQNAQPNDAQPGEPSPNGGNAGQPADGSQQQPADGAQQQQPGDQKAATGGRAEEQAAPPDKVSAEGDDDGTAFNRIADHMAQKEGKQNGEQDSQKAATGGRAPQANQDPAAPSDANQKPTNEQDANSSPASAKQSSGAGQSEQPSGQKPPADGAKPEGPAENPAGAEPQTQSGGQNPSPREGPDVPREAKTGDGKPQDNAAAQQPSPDSAMNRNDGDAGAGGSTGKEQGSPGDEASAQRARDKTDDDNRQRNDDGEPPGGSPDKRESDSEGGKSGEQTGGGGEGAGQHADAEGKGEAGQNEADDEGAGQAAEQGQGDTGTKAGSDQLAAGKTGQSSGDQPDEGSEQGAGAQKAATAGRGANQPNAPTEGAPPADQPKSDQPEGASTKGQPGAGEPSQPSDQPSPEQPGESPSPDAQPNPQEGQPQQPNAQGAAGATQPQGGGAHGGQQTPATSAPDEPDKADEANLEFARQQTDLVLERLDEQLAKKDVDRDLLKNLGWDENDLRRFVDRWKNLKTKAADGADESADAKVELDAALRSLGLRREGPRRFRAAAKADEVRNLNDAYRARAPLEYADRVREYVKGAAAANP